MNVPEPRMHQLRPFGGRVIVMESEVSEDQLSSGLIVPILAESSSYKRGVVLQIDESLGAGVLSPGMVVYYSYGTKIGDVTLIEPASIIAYFEADE